MPWGNQNLLGGWCWRLLDMKGGGEAVGPKSEIQLLKKGSLPLGAS